MTFNTLQERLHDFTRVPGLKGQPGGFGASFPAATRALTHDAPQEVSHFLLCRVAEWPAEGNRLSNAFKDDS